MWRLFTGILLSIMGSCATYFIAYAIYSSSAPRSAALSLVIFTLLFTALLSLSFMLPYHVQLPSTILGYSPYIGKSSHHVLWFLVAFFLFTLTVVNLVLVLVWRNTGPSLSLRG
ncbi:hypothetical protein BC826DRAFT_576862 [Russula brevipes]|nr:hypothetical protein BC826DRAFT_576862 [Russula brevipes]